MLPPTKREALVDVDRAKLTCPVHEVLGDVAMDGLQVGQVEVTRERTSLKFCEALPGIRRLSACQQYWISEVQAIPEHPGLGVNIRVLRHSSSVLRAGAGVTKVSVQLGKLLLVTELAFHPASGDGPADAVELLAL